MDCFSPEFLEAYIKQSKKQIVNKLEGVDLTKENLPQHSDSLCMVLDYSPKIYHNREYKIDLLRKFNLAETDQDGLANAAVSQCTSSRTLNLVRKTSGTDDSLYLVRKNSSFKLINEFVKDLVNEIIENVEKFIEDRPTIHVDCPETNNQCVVYKHLGWKRLKENEKAQSHFWGSKVGESAYFSKNNILNLTIYIKNEPNVQTIVNLNEQNETPLREVLKYLIDENKLHPRNFNLYYFSEHVTNDFENEENCENSRTRYNTDETLKELGEEKRSKRSKLSNGCTALHNIQNNSEKSDSNLSGVYNYEPSPSVKDKKIGFMIDEEDLNKEININTQIKDLTTNRLDLCMKKFQDLPEFNCLSYYNNKPFHSLKNVKTF